ncbi:MAG: hypothetical protein K6B28_09430 [Lachnospiraceae bacterium]|nr:hypothetical protein [Lachnospiraceae bacterium]
MLGKLIKHDFIATWKIPVSIDAALIILSILTAIVLQAVPQIDDSIGMSIFTFSFVGLFYIGIIAANVVTIVYLVIRYYRNLYTSEGYLTFTLPVKTDMIIHSKVITGTVWVFLSYLCTIISLLIAGLGLFNTIDVPREDIIDTLREIGSVIGFSEPGFTGILVLTFIITPVSTVLSMYFCVSIGQLWQNHKVLGAVLCIIGLYIINQLVSQFAFMGSGFYNLMLSQEADIDLAFGRVYRNMLLIINIIVLIQSIIYYMVCLIISRKKLNLD